ncbi:MAG: glycosyltransferase [Ruminococcus sp.]|nr:glycosyltransferase [Ruminococcus sp.]
MNKNILRILEVNKSYFPHTGGIETIVRQYSEEIGKTDGIQLKTLVCRDNFGMTYHENINGVNLTRSGSFGTFFSCPVSLSFIKIFRKMAENADIVHIHMPFPLADIALMMSGYRKKVVISWHSDIVRQKKLLIIYKPFLKYTLSRADCILTATEGHIKGSEWLKDYSYKCKILPYGLNTEKYSDIKKMPYLTEKCTCKKSIKVFFSGRLVYYKGVETLIKAFCHVRGCELFISGQGVLEKNLKEKVQRYGLEKTVHFLGFLPENQLKQAYADCDIFVLPSTEKSEAFGIVQLEAMIYGKPVINTSLDSGVPYVSIHGKTGLTVKPENHRQLAKAINYLADNPDIREKFGESAQKRVLTEFNEKDIIKRLYKIFKDEVRK